MKVLVDTSAWVDFLNGYKSPTADALSELLEGQDDVCTCGLVVTEVFQGLRNERSRSEIARLFREMTFLEPSGIDSYLRAAELFRRLREKGRTVRSAADCIIASIAEDAGCHLLARDRDLEAILASGLTKVRAWSAGAAGGS
ncbi:MAG TPA: PIN domain nuclease [Dehalococcoidia bacterium]|nr:PIN domain nuclease [Dehalococcoidia bacterium]